MSWCQISWFRTVRTFADCAVTRLQSNEGDPSKILRVASMWCPFQSACNSTKPMCTLAQLAFVYPLITEPTWISSENGFLAETNWYKLKIQKFQKYTWHNSLVQHTLYNQNNCELYNRICNRKLALFANNRYCTCKSIVAPIPNHLWLLHYNRHHWRARNRTF